MLLTPTLLMHHPKIYPMEKIVVIDNGLDIPFAVKQLLGMKGFFVEDNPNWNRMFSNMEDVKPDLIILDINLEGLGSNAFAHLKDSDDTQHIPIILYSSGNKFQDEYMGCKVQAFVNKPFDQHLLNEAMENLN
jgi:two-component SAPR family response regulator